jgi:hypothetical protein
MPSEFAWLDGDDEQRRRMLAVVELFRDEGTVDELGIGTIRDTIADVLFPGTSVLHTRARYLLFVPWLLLEAQRTANVSAAVAELRRLEIKLIYALLRGGESQGVIGRQAKERLKRMPSAAYWSATHRFGVRRWDTSVEGFFRRALAAKTQRHAEAETEDAADLGAGLDAYLPAKPGELLKATTFDLTAAEAGFLRDRLLSETKGSLLAWLLAHDDATTDEPLWRHPLRAGFPPELRRVVDHGHRFHDVIHGALLLYNLLLAEQAESPELITRYRADLDGWRAEASVCEALAGWDDDFWAMLGEHSRSVRNPTRVFVTRWIERVRLGGDVATDQDLRALIRSRETTLKGGRARLSNAAALDAWKGRSGLVRLDFRWGVARQLLDDVHQAPPKEAG